MADNYKYYNRREEVDALNEDGNMTKIKRKSLAEDGFTEEVIEFMSGRTLLIRPEDKSKWDNYEEVYVVTHNDIDQGERKYKNVKESDVFTEEVWFEAQKRYIRKSHTGLFQNKMSVTWWNGTDKKVSIKAYPEMIKEDCPTKYTHQVEYNGENWFIRPSDESKWLAAVEKVPGWDGKDEYCREMIIKEK